VPRDDGLALEEQLFGDLGDLGEGVVASVFGLQTQSVLAVARYFEDGFDGLTDFRQGTFGTIWQGR